MAWKSGCRSGPSCGVNPALPVTALAYTTGKSACSSLAPNSMNRSKVWLSAETGSASLRSTLLITTMARWPRSRAFFSTKRVCGMGPSAASTSSSTPSTIFITRSTSPPKSAWPGVSTILILTCWALAGSQIWIAVFLARIVMPRSRSSAFESITRSATCWFSRKICACLSSPSTSVVLPWSTWAMMAILRKSVRSRIIIFPFAKPAACSGRSC